MYIDFPRYSYRPEPGKTEAQITRLSLLELASECSFLFHIDTLLLVPVVLRFSVSFALQVFSLASEIFSKRTVA